MADYDEYAGERAEEDIAAEVARAGVDLSDEADALREKLNAAERAETTECCMGQNVPPSAAALRAQAQQMLEDAAYLERQEARDRLLAREAARPQMPDMDNPGDNAVVMFRKYQNGKDYGYAAFGWREGPHVRWVVTGQETRRLNWAGLLEFIGESNWPTLHVVTETRRIGPDPAQEAPVAEVMGRYGRVERTEPVSASDPFTRPYAAGGLVVGHGLPADTVMVRLSPSPFSREEARRRGNR